MTSLPLTGLLSRLLECEREGGPISLCLQVPGCEQMAHVNVTCHVCDSGENVASRWRARRQTTRLVVDGGQVWPSRGGAVRDTASSSPCSRAVVRTPGARRPHRRPPRGQHSPALSEQICRDCAWSVFRIVRGKPVRGFEVGIVLYHA